MRKLLVLVAMLLVSSNVFAIEKITSKEFNDVIKQDKVVIEYFSPDCPYCRNMEPVITEAEKNKSIKFYKIDVKEQEFAKSQGITSWPTFHVYEKGIKVREVKGLMELDKFNKKIEGTLTVQDRIDELTEEGNNLLNKKNQAIDAVNKIDQRLLQIQGAVTALEEVK